jgi:ABC-type transport system involved in multi-copper enzyme maturation permease subunit
MSVRTIARFTVQEAISRRLVLAGVLLSLAFVGLFALGFAFAYDRALDAAATPRGRMVPALAASLLTLLGLQAVHFLSSLLAVFLTAGSVSGEIDSGTILAVLARPVRRAEFLLGRWLAYVGLVALYVGLMAGLLLLIARLIAGYEPFDAVPAVALMALGPVGLLTLGLLGSALLPTLANGVVVLSLFGLAWLAGIIEFVGNVLSNQAMVNLGIVVSLLVPSDALWRGASYFLQSPALLALAGPAGGALPFASNAPPSGPFVAWAALYPLALLLAAILTFARRDL